MDEQIESADRLIYLLQCNEEMEIVKTGAVFVF